MSTAEERDTQAPEPDTAEQLMLAVSITLAAVALLAAMAFLAIVWPAGILLLVALAAGYGAYVASTHA